MVLDEAWDGTPGAVRIRQEIEANMRSVGWPVGRFAAIVIQPELENWIWQDSPHLAAAFRFTKQSSLREWLSSQQLWPIGRPKPPDPKKAVERTLRTSRMPRSSSIYFNICRKVSIRGCTDESSQVLLNVLRAWFPLEEPDRLGG